jgi:hypothetical protein
MGQASRRPLIDADRMHIQRAVEDERAQAIARLDAGLLADLGRVTPLSLI